MNVDNNISVIAGRPGAGKTLWAAREAVDCLRDPNNVVFYIGFDQEFDRICRMVRSKYGANPHGRLLFALQDGAGEAIVCRRRCCFCRSCGYGGCYQWLRL